MYRVESRVRRRWDVRRGVAGHESIRTTRGDAEVRHGDLEGPRVGLPAHLVVTADHRVEPVGHVVGGEERSRQLRLAVGHQPHRPIEGGDDGRRMVVDAGRLGAGGRILDVVNGRPEGLAREDLVLEEAVPTFLVLVSESLGLPRR
jgi:hypothetical protein